MRLTLRITFAYCGQPEHEVYRSDVLTPDAVSLTREVALRTARATLNALGITRAYIAEYLGETLISTSVM